MHDNGNIDIQVSQGNATQQAAVGQAETWDKQSQKPNRKLMNRRGTCSQTGGRTARHKINLQKKKDCEERTW
jgi:hypothetical protein